MSKNRLLAVVTLLTLLGFALRVYALGRVPFRGDEAFTVLNWIEPSLAITLASDIPLRDPQPPLAYVLFWAWSQAVGTSELAVRLLSVMAGTIGIPALYALGVRLRGRYVGLIGALLWTVHPYLIWHAQDARNYALWSTLSALALWLALRALVRRRALDWGLYVLAAVAAAYTYYLELFVLLALNVFVFVAYWRRWQLLRQWVVVQCLIACFLAPWFLQERLLTGSGYTGTTYSAEVIRLFDWFLPTLTFGETLSPVVATYVWPLILVATLLGIVSFWSVCRRCALLLALLSVVPPLLLTVVSLRLDVFTPRYVLGSAPAFVVSYSGLIAFGVTRLGRPVVRRVAATGLIMAWLLVSVASLLAYYFDYAKSPDWRALVSYLHPRLDASTLVIQTAADEAFTYYFDNRSDLQRLPASPHQPVEEIAAILEADQRQYSSIWLVANPFPDWPNAYASASWLEANMQTIRDSVIAGLPARQFAPWQVHAAELPDDPSVEYGDSARLRGVRVLYPPEPSGLLTIVAYWQPLNNTDTNLKVFVHLVPEAEEATAPVAQDDQFPQDGRINTQSWTDLELFRDVYTLAIESLPSGRYNLLIGLYDPVTGARIPLADGNDSYRAAAIVLP